MVCSPTTSHEELKNLFILSAFHLTIEPGTRPLETSILHSETAQNKKAPSPLGNRAFSILSRQRPTLPHTYACSTIGPAGLNFRVRDGNGWNPRGMVTDNLRRIAGVGARSRNPERICEGYGLREICRANLSKNVLLRMLRKTARSMPHN